MSQAPIRQRMWDLYIRIYHGGLILLLPLLWYTAEEGLMERHQQAALVLLGLLLGRILWGFWGSENARFSHFVRGPKAVFDHVKTLGHGHDPQAGHPYGGHNPVGGWSVMLLLLALLVQGSTGLFATDAILFDGPLRSYVSGDTADVLTDIHKTNINIIYGLIVLHLLAIIFYRLRGYRLIGPMIHGKQWLSAQVKAPSLKSGAWGLVIAVIIIAVLFWLATNL